MVVELRQGISFLDVDHWKKSFIVLARIFFYLISYLEFKREAFGSSSSAVF